MHSFGGVDESLKAQLLINFRAADITEEEVLILEYAEKITKQPASITKTDVDKLLENGFTQAGVHDIVQATAYFNYVNRLADALGVELEPE